MSGTQGHTDAGDAYQEYIARRRLAESRDAGSSRPPSTSWDERTVWGKTRYVLGRALLIPGYASFVIPIVGGFIAAFFFALSALFQIGEGKAAERQFEKERGYKSGETCLTEEDQEDWYRYTSNKNTSWPRAWDSGPAAFPPPTVAGQRRAAQFRAFVASEKYWGRWPDNR